jgi:hypothetical protein
MTSFLPIVTLTFLSSGVLTFSWAAKLLSMVRFDMIFRAYACFEGRK